MPLDPAATDAALAYAPEPPAEVQPTLERPRSGDLPLPLAGVAGAVLTAATHFGLQATGTGYLATLVLERGWMQYASVFLAWTALAVLASRAQRAFVAQRDLEGVSRLPGAGVAVRGDRAALIALRDRWARAGGIAGLRRARALQAYLAAGSRAAASSAAEDDTAQAEAALDAAYTVPRVAVWAIPLIGFIGTVVGISAAVAGFAGFLQTAEEIEQIKSGIGGVTTGLAVAFDTTLLALALSVAVMIPLVLLERFERRIILGLDADTQDQVIARLADVSERAPQAPAGADEAAVRRVVREAIHEAIPSPEALVQDARLYLQNAAAEVARSAQDAARSVSEASRALLHLQAEHRAEVERESAAARERMEIRDRQAAQALGDFARSLAQQQHAAAAQARAETTAAGSLLADAVREASQPLRGIAETLAHRVEELGALSRQTSEVLAVEQSVHRSVEALQQTGHLQEVLVSVDASLRTLKPALERLSLPRTITLVEADGSIRPADGRGNP